MHDFKESLAKSAAQVDAPWWPIVYRRAFPTLSSHSSVRDDGWAQRAGIDRVLVLKCGRTVTVDEKVRERDYGDILLEYWSDHERRLKGWAVKPLACEYIAYAVVETETCFLFPTLTLQSAVRANMRVWWQKAEQGMDGFRQVRAHNRSYVTVSVAVPKPVFFAAMRDALIVSWDEIGEVT